MPSRPNGLRQLVQEKHARWKDLVSCAIPTPSPAVMGRLQAPQTPPEGVCRLEFDLFRTLLHDKQYGLLSIKLQVPSGKATLQSEQEKQRSWYFLPPTSNAGASPIGFLHLTHIPAMQRTQKF